MSSLYSPLPPHIEHNLERLDLKELDCSRNKYVETFMSQQLKDNNKKDEILTKMRIKGVMLDSINMNHPKKKNKKRFKTMNSQERRRRGIFKISKQNQRYELFLPLHEMWKEYMKEIMGETNQCETTKTKFLASKIIKADFHGAILTVSKSKCPSYVGLSGIMIQELKNVFKIITKQNELKTLPKINSVFTVDVGGYLCTLYGNHLRVRSAERSSKKLKSKSTTDL
ncbi:ribonuclease P protein subunit p29-like [Xenia sp. Carnegie-2017]|uniref:ribonuclease P protein subunit p29-like n=1 Tax=Xenia sp. Carnegie-2017 TaxID=2897299 RepID=UPI001F044FA5|nr:ribonuclease P protein subunit p29-like [Xenia sp. Carnegie-2017]